MFNVLFEIQHIILSACILIGALNYHYSCEEQPVQTRVKTGLVLSWIR